MQPTRSNTSRRRAREAIATTPQPFDATPERPPQTTPPRPRPTHDDGSAPTEIVRVTDVAAHGHGRACLVERGLEQDGYAALKALVADYLGQAELLAAVPMAVCPLDSEAGEEAER
jgi:hypothetical protein